MLFGSEKNLYDLARDASGTVKIGDNRNDENHIVSQLHGAFGCFHNLVMSMLDQGKINVRQALGGVRADALQGLGEAQIKFEAARRLVRHHYQHLVVNQLLDDFVDDKVLKQLKRQLHLENCPNPLTANLIQRLCQSNFQVQRFDMVMQLNNRLMCSMILCNRIHCFKWGGMN